MIVTVNGKPVRVEAGSSLAEALHELGYSGSFFAVALNRRCVSRARYPETAVQEGDEIEIIAPMQGG